MPIIRPPARLPTLYATLGLFRHPHPGLTDPALLPRIERSLSAGRLDPQWLQAYRDCIGIPAGRDQSLPPLTLQIAAAPLHMAILADAGFPFAAMGLVHMSQHVSQTRAIADSEVLTLRAWSADARLEKRGMSFALITEASCAGDLVWRGETRALAPDKAKRVAPASGSPRLETEPAPTGALLCEERLQVAESCGRRYAAIAGDLNPIHQHALLARPFGFRRAIVHGTWTLARALEVAGLPRIAAWSMQAAFRRPVELPSQILVRAWAGDGQQQFLEVSSADGRRPFISVQLRDA
jgi:acyl dehydratase